MFFIVIPHPHYPDVGARFYENARSALPAPTEPPPAHRNMMSGTPPINYAPATELHLLPKALEREREQREKERKSSIPGSYTKIHLLMHNTQTVISLAISTEIIANDGQLHLSRTFKYAMPKWFSASDGNTGSRKKLASSHTSACKSSAAAS